MSRTEFIIDYEENKSDIEYWFSIKCEQRYREYAKFLPNYKGTWAQISGLYRYDKRLAFNLFKYLSFLEESLRAEIVRNADDKEKSYEIWQKKYLSDFYREFDGEKRTNLEKIVGLRNRICHENILLDADLQENIEALCMLLPENYKTGFKKDINGCKAGLDISASIALLPDI